MSNMSKIGTVSMKQDATVIAKIQQTLEALRSHSFALFAAVNLSAPSTSGCKLFVISVLLQTLQWLWFPLTTTAAFPWTDNYLSWLRGVSKIARFDLFITQEATVTVPVAVPIVLMSLCLLLYAAAGLICKQLHAINQSLLSVRPSGEQNSAKGAREIEGEANTVRAFASRSWLLHAFTTALSWSSSFLFLPLSALLIGTIRCPAGESSCYEGSHLASVVMGMLTLALWLPLCFLYVAFKFPRSIHIASMAEEQSSSANETSFKAGGQVSTTPVSQTMDYNDRAHNRLALLALVAAGATVAAFELSTSSSSTTQWGLALAYLAMVTIRLLAQLWYLPMLNRFSQSLEIGTVTILVWSGLCLLMVLVYNDENQVVASVFFLLGAPLVVALSHFVLSRRRQWLQSQPMTSIQDPLLMEARLRLESQFAVQTVASQLDHSSSRSSDSPFEASKDCARSHGLAVQRMLEQCLEVCKTSSSAALLSLQVARMCSGLPAGRQRVALLLHLSASREPALDVQFGLYCLQQSLDECLNEDMKELSVQRYMRFQALSTSATEQVIVAARCQKAFFTELAAPEPNVERLTKEGAVG